MTITIEAHPGSNHYTAEARTKAGIVELRVTGVWQVVVAALRAYVEGLA